MEYKITPQLLSWSALSAPFRVQVLLLVILLADDNGCCGITTPGARQSMESRTTISWTTFLVTLRELHKLGVIDFDGKVARIKNLPEGIEVCDHQEEVPIEPDVLEFEVEAMVHHDASELITLPDPALVRDGSVITPHSPRRFHPPTISEVASYVSEKGYHFDPETFWHFYESKGWMIGKSKMKSWHSACATFEKRRRTEQFTQTRKSNYELQRDQARAQLFAAEAQRNVTANTAESGDLAISDF